MTDDAVPDVNDLLELANEACALDLDGYYAHAVFMYRSFIVGTNMLVEEMKTMRAKYADAKSDVEKHMASESQRVLDLLESKVRDYAARRDKLCAFLDKQPIEKLTDFNYQFGKPAHNAPAE